MIASMTGFARSEQQYPWGCVTWELRSVNHRFLDLNFKIPEVCRRFEPQWREQVSHVLGRGKADLLCRLQLTDDNETMGTLNPVALERIGQQIVQLQTQFPAATLSVTELLKMPGVRVAETFDYEAVVAELSAGLAKALASLNRTRVAEGEALSAFLQSHLHTMKTHVHEVDALMPTVLQQVEDRMRAKLEELEAVLDTDRLEQELVWYAQKIDVTEEVKRLHCHIDAFSQALDQGGVIGRRLDFLAQELNRETNTLASKSIDATVTHLALELKVLIEQVREQVQNIE